MKKRILRPLPGMDLPFLILVLTLVGFGLVMLASASSAVALYRRGDAWAYLRPQLLYAALGLCGMWLASRVDYHIFHKLAWPLLGLSLILLAAVLFMPEYNGCKRWLVIPGFGTLQPSEIAKFAVVLVFSHIIALNHDRMKDFSVGVLPFALVLGVVAALMLLEPHLSGTVLILGIGAVLMFVGGTGLRWFLLAGAGGVGAIGAAVAVMPDLVPYAADRLRSWLDPFADPLGDGHQTIQSLYAIGSGGATGLGLGNSRQKHLFVPEPQNDFIFSIVCEELGFVGACAVVLLFVQNGQAYSKTVKVNIQGAQNQVSVEELLQSLRRHYADPAYEDSQSDWVAFDLAAYAGMDNVFASAGAKSRFIAKAMENIRPGNATDHERLALMMTALYGYARCGQWQAVACLLVMLAYGYMESQVTHLTSDPALLLLCGAALAGICLRKRRDAH